MILSSAKVVISLICAQSVFGSSIRSTSQAEESFGNPTVSIQHYEKSTLESTSIGALGSNAFNGRSPSKSLKLDETVTFPLVEFIPLERENNYAFSDPIASNRDGVIWHNEGASDRRKGSRPRTLGRGESVLSINPSQSRNSPYARAQPRTSTRSSTGRISSPTMRPATILTSHSSPLPKPKEKELSFADQCSVFRQFQNSYNFKQYYHQILPEKTKQSVQRHKKTKIIIGTEENPILARTIHDEVSEEDEEYE